MLLASSDSSAMLEPTMLEPNSLCHEKRRSAAIAAARSAADPPAALAVETLACAPADPTVLVDSSMESEAIGSSKAGEAISFAREILRAIGRPMEGPTFLSTDNLANQKVGSGTGHPTRARHFLRRYYGLKQRVASGEVKLVHVPDAEMPADFLTKWIPRSKLQVS